MLPFKFQKEVVHSKGKYKILRGQKAFQTTLRAKKKPNQTGKQRPEQGIKAMKERDTFIHSK